jgi:hypothetical protein
MTKTLEILSKHLEGPSAGLYVVKTPLDEIAREIDEASQPLPEITDDEIDEAAAQYVKSCQPLPLGQDAAVKADFTEGAEWYRKQLQK